MRKLEYISSGSEFIPKPHGQFIVTTDCYNCGYKTRVAIDKDDEFDRTEAAHWEERYKGLMGELNSLLRYIEVETGWRPDKECVVRMLIELRDKFTSKED